MQGVTLLQCHGPIHASWIWHSNPKKVWLCSFLYCEGAHGIPQTPWCVLPFSSLLLLVFNTFSPKGLFDDSHWLFKVLFNWSGVATASLTQIHVFSPLLYSRYNLYLSDKKKGWKCNVWRSEKSFQRSVPIFHFVEAGLSCVSHTAHWRLADWRCFQFSPLPPSFRSRPGGKMHTTASVLFLMWVWRIKYGLLGFPG